MVRVLASYNVMMTSYYNLKSTEANELQNIKVNDLQSIGEVNDSQFFSVIHFSHLLHSGSGKLICH